jgi:hypothetical protein
MTPDELLRNKAAKWLSQAALPLLRPHPAHMLRLGIGTQTHNR